VPEHLSLRERLEALGMHDEPVFEGSNDPTLAAFATLFYESELFTFAADRHLRTGALTPIYDCETQSRRSPDADVETFVVTWAPVWAHTDPVTGFRTGGDSSVFGTAPTVAMPPDERTAALLLLVTTTFVHLSASRADSGTPVQGAVAQGAVVQGAVVQGAVEADDGGYRFLELVPTEVGDRAPGSDRPALNPAGGL
jgi:hypothetical protein